MHESAPSRTTSEWEAVVGTQVRELRIRARLTQAELAERANVSESSVRSLEHGAGSSLSTVVSVVRALGRTDWLEELAPPQPPSPLAALRAAQAAERSLRRPVRRRADGS